MKTISTRRTTAAAGAVLATTLFLTGCGTNTENDTDQNTQTEAVTATTDPQTRQDQVAEQVIDYYQQVSDLEAGAEDGRLGEEAREFATYSWIDDRNTAASLLRQHGETLQLIERRVTDYQVLDFNDTGSGADAWTVRLNLCLENRMDYREEDGTVIEDPDDILQGTEEITAKYDGPNDVWKLTAFEKGAADACGYESQTTGPDDSATTTEEP